MKTLNPSVKHHFLIGIFISIWLFIFAFFIRPFDDGTISFKAWILISTGFSLIAFLCYALLAIVQKSIYIKISKWSVGFEIGAILCFHLLFLVGTFLYYKSPILNGGYDFLHFSDKIILKSALISTPIIVLARIYVTKLIPQKEEGLISENENIIIRGENKLDILRIKKSDLVCVSNAQNYVEIFFVENNQLKSKLIRSTLKKVQTDFDFLVQIHRSHLVNPSHFKAWKNQQTISLTQIDLPVSKNYKDNLLFL
ncbi:LytTR family DNA-binding domain-containing protein [Flavobacterium hercynium]|uniref:Histidine kinase n=1 Tax=Flavobacterium hercynium TaxID=387094 RepID=A0A226GYW1_9FLAO|nr:LytTR family DNA-binding domain-containing protein [Flavobacterium hercynium]OXA86601.1 histidine kinase [Flavobacterium hercynium]SMP25366.1 transcriptional regulator, LytTR family [Flavobacterium hercynium]